MHASMVPLVLNLDSGAITTTFHVVIDDCFATVPVPEGQTLPPELWSHLFGDFHYQYVFNDDDEDDYDIVLQDEKEDVLQQDFVGTTIQNVSPALPLPVLPSAATHSALSDALPSDQLNNIAHAKFAWCACILLTAFRDSSQF